MSLPNSQNSSPQSAAPPRRVDVHCHCLPGIDDGPQSMDDAIALGKLLVADGFTDIIATPHMLGRWDGVNLAPQIRAAVQQLQAALNGKKIPLKIHPGGEVRVDERHPTTTGRRADSYARRRPQVSADRAFHVGVHRSGGAAGVSFNDGCERDPGAPGAVRGAAARSRRRVCVDREWRGDPGQCRCAACRRRPRRSRRRGIGCQRGWVSLVATDAHGAINRRPRMAEASELITRKLGDVIARRVCVENPLRILEGKEITRVAASEF